MHSSVPRHAHAGRRRAAGLLGAIIAMLVLALATAGKAEAVPIEWSAWVNITPAALNANLQQNNERLIDLQVTSTSPLLFSATAVANTGANGTAWWWFYGISGAQVGAAISQNNARLISAYRYGNAYAVVMVANTGANATGWWWYDTDASGINATTQANNSRVTNIMSYAPGRFVVIEVDNAGANNRSWWWFAGISWSQLSILACVNANTPTCGSGHANTLDITYNNDGSNTFNLAMVAGNNDGRAFSFDDIGKLITYARLSPPDRPGFVTPYGNGVTVVTSLYHNS
jgi:hypothetical protein